LGPDSDGVRVKKNAVKNADNRAINDAIKAQVARNWYDNVDSGFRSFLFQSLKKHNVYETT
jgi:hypothetical protein